MNFLRFFSVGTILAVSGLFAAPSTFGADAPPLAAGELAGKLSALRQDGNSYVRLRMEVKGPTPQTLQLQIKQRQTKNSTEILYQVLFPKERKGESVLLRRSGNRAASGSLFTPPNTVRPINDLKDPMLGGDLSYDDIIENFFAWDQQAIVGNETVDGVNCQILESKSGKGDRTIYGSVRSWIDVADWCP